MKLFSLSSIIVASAIAAAAVSAVPSDAKRHRRRLHHSTGQRHVQSKPLGDRKGSSNGVGNKRRQGNSKFRHASDTAKTSAFGQNGHGQHHGSNASAHGKGDEIVGAYSWNWGKGSSFMLNSNEDVTMSVAFTGLVDVRTAIAAYPLDATWCCPALKGSTFLSLGGGNAGGIITVDALRNIENDLNLIHSKGYNGIMIDAEEAYVLV